MFHIYTVALNALTVIGHLMWVSLTLISLLHNLDILIEMLAMYITRVAKTSRKFIEMALEEMNLYAHVAA